MHFSLVLSFRWSIFAKNGFYNTQLLIVELNHKLLVWHEIKRLALCNGRSLTGCYKLRVSISSYLFMFWNWSYFAE